MSISHPPYYIQLFNYSVFQEIVHLKLLFDKILHHDFEFHYTFDHNLEETVNELAINQTELEHCTCLYNCHPFFLYQASQYPKSFTDFYESILMTNTLNVKQTMGFGINGLFQFLQQIEETKKQEQDALKDLKIQSGGGSGFGFQLYCDETVVLTAGGGGGGGFYFNGGTNNVNFGAGAGAGLQFANLSDDFFSTGRQKNLTFHSIGGGGGCGTCNDPTDDATACGLASQLFPHDNQQSSITCGFKHDEDAISNETLSELLRLFRSSLPKCREIMIYGGGGGGGGSSMCCSPAHIGYGFAFSLHYVNDPHLPRSQMIYNFHSEQFETNDRNGEKEEENINSDREKPIDSRYSVPSSEIRYQYDFIGKLLHDASQYCHGFASWCCVCNQTQSVINSCLSWPMIPPNDDIISEDDTIHTRKGSHHLLEDPDCQDIQKNYARISWLIDHQCCITEGKNQSLGSNTTFIRTNITNHSLNSEQPITNLFNFSQYRFYSFPRSSSSLSVPLINQSELPNTDSSAPTQQRYHVIINLGENSQTHSDLFNQFSDCQTSQSSRQVYDPTSSSTCLMKLQDLSRSFGGLVEAFEESDWDQPLKSLIPDQYNINASITSFQCFPNNLNQTLFQDPLLRSSSDIQNIYRLKSDNETDSILWKSALSSFSPGEKDLMIVMLLCLTLLLFGVSLLASAMKQWRRNPRPQQPLSVEYPSNVYGSFELPR